MARNRRALRAGMFAALLLFGQARADYIHINADTSSVLAADAVLYFDLIDGDGAVNHSVTVFNFTTDGTLTAPPLLDPSNADVAGTLPGDVTLGDSLPISTYSQSIMLGALLAFDFRILGSQDPPVDPAFADALSFTLLDSLGNPLLSDNGVLFRYSIGNPNPLETFSQAVTGTLVAEAAIPEPGALALALAALLALRVVRSNRWRRHQARRT